MIDFEAELDRLAADLAVLDVACGAGTRINWRLEALAAIRALYQVKLHPAWRTAIFVGSRRLRPIGASMTPSSFETVPRASAR